MAFFRVNKDTSQNPKGNHEVHKEGCVHYNSMEDHDELGYHTKCVGAVNSAISRGYSKANGCKICIPLCHTD